MSQERLLWLPELTLIDTPTSLLGLSRRPRPPPTLSRSTRSFSSSSSRRAARISSCSLRFSCAQRTPSCPLAGWGRPGPPPPLPPSLFCRARRGSRDSRDSRGCKPHRVAEHTSGPRAGKRLGGGGAESAEGRGGAGGGGAGRAPDAAEASPRRKRGGVCGWGGPRNGNPEGEGSEIWD